MKISCLRDGSIRIELPSEDNLFSDTCPRGAPALVRTDEAGTKVIGQLISFVMVRSQFNDFLGKLNEYAPLSVEELESKIENWSKDVPERCCNDIPEFTSNFLPDLKHGGYTFHRGRWFTTGKYFIQLRQEEKEVIEHQFTSETEMTEDMWLQKADELIALENQCGDKFVIEFATKESALEHYNKGCQVLSPCGKFVLDDEDISQHFDPVVEGDE